MLLSETELRSALEPLLDRLLVERLRFFQLQLEPRLQALIDASLAGAANRPGAVGEDGWGSLLAASDPNQVFAAVFASSAAWVGSARALLVTLRGESAVWASQELSLPPRIPPAARAAALRALPGRASAAYPILVRGVEVGLLYWEAAAEPPPAALERLQRLLQIAGWLLLSLALPPAPAAPRRQAESQPAGVRPSAPPTPNSPESRFAHLLIEDLVLYLEREQPRELAAARRRGDATASYQAELERCRRAFEHRFTDAGADIFEEAARRLDA